MKKTLWALVFSLGLLLAGGSFSITSFAGVLAGGNTHYTVVCGDGTVWGWGNHDEWQLGVDDYVYDGIVQADSISNVRAVEAGTHHTVALKHDGTVWIWGTLAGGCSACPYGVGVWETPVQVSGLTGVIAISAGGSHSLALKSDGTVWAWATNSNGQLGDGTTTNRNSPVQVSDLSGVIAIAAGYSHSLALKSDGTVWAWGYNGQGQLGDDSSTDRSTPVQVSNLTGVVAIGAGGDANGGHSMALKVDGTVWAWGYNGQGQLGDDTSTNRDTPVQASNLTGVIAIAAGGRHSLAVKNNGSAWAWGYNGEGQLGDDSTTNRDVPVQVSSLTGVTAIAGGINHSLGLKNDGNVYRWGLGGWFSSSDVPVSMSQYELCSVDLVCR
ncbi:MAG: RCC1 domain-containing protein [Gammaproteobacteria bacterium]